MFQSLIIKDISVYICTLNYLRTTVCCLEMCNVISGSWSQSRCPELLFCQSAHDPLSDNVKSNRHKLKLLSVCPKALKWKAFSNKYKRTDISPWAPISWEMPPSDVFWQGIMCIKRGPIIKTIYSWNRIIHERNSASPHEVPSIPSKRHQHFYRKHRQRVI